MGPRLKKALMVFSLLGFLGAASCATAPKQESYFTYPSGRLQFKLPPGEWERVKLQEKKDVPSPYNAFIVGNRPNVVLAAAIRPAVIFIWTERSHRDLSEKSLKAYAWLEKFLKRRERAVDRSGENTSFDYELYAKAIAARTSLTGEFEDFQVKGSGKAMFYFHKGSSYLHYFELLADADVFDAVKEEFTQALEETHGY